MKTIVEVSFERSSNSSILESALGNNYFFEYSCKNGRCDVRKTPLLEGKVIECRPVVTGNFARNCFFKYFDYEISGSLERAEHLDKSGFFVGNHQVGLQSEINLLHKVLKNDVY